MAGGDGYTTSLQHVLAELARLDLFLRGIAGTEVDALLVEPVGAAVRSTESVHPELPEEIAGALQRCGAEIADRVTRSTRRGVPLRLVALAELFDLTPFDVDVIVIALAPEFDRRYERLYAYLQDDVTRRAPTVDLVLSLLCGGEVEAKVAARTRFADSAALVRHQLVTLADDPAQRSASLLARDVRLDPRVARFLLDDDEMDARLRPYARIVVPDVGLTDLVFPAEVSVRLDQLATHADDDLVLYFQGPYGVGKQSAAAACCQRWGRLLLVVDTEPLAAHPAEEFAALLTLLDREARLQGAVMFCDNADVLLREENRAHQALLLSTLATRPGPALLAGDLGWEPADAPDTMTFLRLDLPPPGYDQRLQLWGAALDEVGSDRSGRAELDLATLSGRFRLTGGQIRDAAATASTLALARTPDAPALTQDDLLAACRLQSNRRLGALAQRITPHYTWNDIVLPADRMAQLREIVDQIRYRELVYQGWGFEQTVARGRGLAMLFAGPSGTGKTMAAEVLAHELGLDLYKIDLSTVVSKFIGETEKNLSRIFAEAATSNAILFFDEADALFGKRTQVRDAHDRYANLEISYLLQRMEEYDGVVILATNLRKNMDEAFVRRLHFTLDFPMPDVEDRRRIWERIWPAAAPRNADVDVDVLARQIDLPGGNIRNIAVAGAFLAAADGGSVTMAHLIRATQREYQKMGKVLIAENLAE